MSGKTSPEALVEYPLAGLDGFTERFGELSACSLVFHLSSANGQSFHLSLKDILTALNFAEEQRLIAPLPAGWWQDLGDLDGCGIQIACGETNDLPD